MPHLTQEKKKEKTHNIKEVKGFSKKDVGELFRKTLQCSTIIE